MRITGGKAFHVREGFVQRDVCTDGSFLSAASGDGRVLEVDGCYIIPGLTDIHFHGCVGEDFSDGDAKGLERMAVYQLSQGVTQICPAGMTLEREALMRMCQTAAAHRAANRPGAFLCGINLEGPFLSADKKGAQNGAWLQPPDAGLLRALDTASGGLVKLVSVAPELPGALDFIEAVGEEYTVSLAHTTADYETAHRAFQAGARHVTHLYNAMPPFSHRAPGVVGAAFDAQACRVELICDGVHINPSVVRATFQMFGASRVVLISDSIRATGMPDGTYTLGGQAVTVEGSRATLADGTLAGSVQDLMQCLKNCVRMGVPMEEAVLAAAVNPAKVIHTYSRTGSLDFGKLANLAVLDGNLELKAVVFRGEVVYSAL